VSQTERVTDPRAAPTSDLERPHEDLWAALTVPADRREVARLARHLAARLDPVADHIVTCVQREVAAYVPGAVPDEDLRASVVSTGEMLLVGLAEHRAPTEEEIAVRRELGVRRARQGLPVDAVIAAYHVGAREMWRALVRADDDRRASAQLLEAATTYWHWVHAMTDAVAVAHAQTSRQLEARVVGARQRLVELLEGGDADGPEALALARSLGLDPEGAFTALAVAGAADDRDAVELQRRTDGLPGAHAVVGRGGVVVLVTTSDDLDDLDGPIRAVVPQPTIGIGLTRPGLRGAADSLRDATEVLEVTPPGTTGTFDRDWLWATLAGTGARWQGVLAPGRRVALEHPHLAEAVRAFGATQGFSVSEAGRQLAVHPNTVAYRLERWAELTGWDPRSFPGLVRSLAAIRDH
jgi:hypothetical protein